MHTTLYPLLSFYNRYKRAKERSRTKNKHHGARALLDLNNDQEPELLTTPIHVTTLHAQPFPVSQFMLQEPLEKVQ